MYLSCMFCALFRAEMWLQKARETPGPSSFWSKGQFLMTDGSLKPQLERSKAMRKVLNEKEVEVLREKADDFARDKAHDVAAERAQEVAEEAYKEAYEEAFEHAYKSAFSN